MLLERATYPAASPEHGIEEGDKYQAVWCCKHENNVWTEDQEPPCDICPNNVKLTERNFVAAQAFRDLDTSGRDIGFDVGYIREEAIDRYLNRIKENTVSVYQALVMIDREVTAWRRDQSEKKREAQKRKTATKPSTKRPARRR